MAILIWLIIESLPWSAIGAVLGILITESIISRQEDIRHASTH